MDRTYINKIAPRLDDIRQARAQGAAAGEVSRLIGVSQPTLRKYLKLAEAQDSPYRGLAKAYAGIEDVPCEEQRVEEALYKACTGYIAVVKKHYKVKKVEYDQVTGKKIRETEEIVEADDEVHVPASIMAQKFYLMNRLPERWQVKLREDEDGEAAGVIVIPEVMDECDFAAGEL